MGAIIRTALRLRLIVVTLAAVLIIAGPGLLRNAPLDVFPEFAPPLVEIQTEAPGLSTEDVEALVTVPIENALIGIAWLETVRSKSVLGLSSVVLLFERGTDLMEARQLVQERVTRVSVLLPDVAKPPVILSPLSSTSRVMKIGLSSEVLDQMELTTLAKWTIRPRLMSVPGVANVAIWGQRDRQLQILVDPDRLRAHDVTLDDVERAGRDAVSVGAGGFVDTPNQRLAVTHRANISSTDDLAQVTVAFRDGAVLTLGDVADVVEGFPLPIGDAIINDGPGLLLIVEKQPWGNTLDVSRGVEEALKSLAPGLSDVEIDPTIFRPATFIEMSIHNLNRAFFIGCLLVIVILGAFLYDWRTAIISLLAMPLSLLAAALVIRYQGGTINTMVLAGLVIALGVVVDDAIIDVENIMRRLRLNAQAGKPQSAFRVVFDASLEVRSAVVYGSLIVILVFLPVFFLQGLAGTFFRPLAYSYILAIVASLVVALTLTPALCLILLPARAEQRQADVPLVKVLKARYRELLPRFIARPRRAVWIIVLSVGAALLVYPFLGEEFLPRFKEYDFLMHWVEKPGTSLEAMNRITLQASRELRSIDGVRNFGSHTGRAEVADEVVGPNFTELWISLDPSVDYDPTVAKIQAVVDGYPGLYRDLLTYLRERVKEVLTGAGATIVVRIYGPNLDVLQQEAREVERAIADVEGVVDLHVQPQVLVPQIDVRFRPDAARRFGLTPGDVQRAVTTLVKGVKVGEFYEDQMVFDIALWGVERVRSDPAALRRLMIDTPLGGQVPLGEVAEVMVVPTRNEVTREGASRKIDVTCNVSGRDLGRVAREIEERVGDLSFEAGYHPEVLGEFAARQESRNRLLSLAALALLGIFLVLHADFRSTKLAVLVFLTVPFALIGGVLGVTLTGGVLSLGALVGFVTVLGIAARNGIMLVSHYRHLEEEEGVQFGEELVVRGAEERLAPILMTALVTGLALLPIIVGGSRPGHEIEHPLAVVILGGLLTSTVLNLLLVPALYLRYGRTETHEPDR
ncbi:MAG: acriflavin resistance protein [Gemmatimonas sp. SM23_52]|nr:MAG: acriflavin resistance protein [Gemmatimonas sp. SM23_52]